MSFHTSSFLKLNSDAFRVITKSSIGSRIAGLYYLKLLEIDKEIKIENEINNEAGGEVEGFNNKISELENSIKTFTDKVNPLREKENSERMARK